VERSVEAGAVEWGELCALEPMVRGWLGRRCRDKSDVDDVVHDTLLRAACFRGVLTRPERRASWALSIAANVLRDRVRRRREICPGIEEFDFDQTPCVAESGAADGTLVIGGRAVTSGEALEWLQASLRAMQPNEAAMLLDYYGGESLGAIAARMGVESKNAKCRLYRARRRLARDLEQRCEASRRVSEAQR